MARRSIQLIVAVAVAALGAAMIFLYVQGADARASEGQDQVSVLVAADVIDTGETVDDAQAAGKFIKAEVAREDAVDGVLVSTASLEGQVARSTIYPGQQIIAQQFGAPGSQQSLAIPDDKLAVSVELTDPARVAGFVNPGSWVAVFVSGDLEAYAADGSTRKLPPYTRVLFPKVQVIGVGDTSVAPRTVKDENGTETTEQIPRTILTLAVTQEQAERLVFSARNGELWFALRTDKSQVVDGPGVTADDIMPEPFGGAR
jgi:pilus assembly protein CpaB